MTEPDVAHEIVRRLSAGAPLYRLRRGLIVTIRPETLDLSPCLGRPCAKVRCEVWEERPTMFARAGERTLELVEFEGAEVVDT